MRNNIYLYTYTLEHVHFQIMTQINLERQFELIHGSDSNLPNLILFLATEV